MAKKSLVRVVSSLNITKDLRKQLESAMKRAEGSYVTVGVHKDAGRYDEHPDVTPGEVAAKMEFGFRRIPARPFLAPSVDENLSKISTLQERGLKNIIELRSTVEHALTAIGTLLRDLIQAKILSNVGPDLSARYLAIKLKKSQPAISLYATGLMWRSVGFKVVLGKEARREADEAAAQMPHSAPEPSSPADAESKRAKAREAGGVEKDRRAAQREQGKEKFKQYMARHEARHGKKGHH